MFLQREAKRLLRGIQKVFVSRGRTVSFVLITFATYALFVLIPVLLTPSNDVVFQLTVVMNWRDHLLFFSLAGLNAFLVMINWHSWKIQRQVKQGLSHVAVSATGSFSAVMATVLGTASCSVCVAGFLGFLGTSGVFFVVNNRMTLTVVAIVFVFVAIILGLRKLDGVCTSCKIDYCK